MIKKIFSLFSRRKNPSFVNFNEEIISFEQFKGRTYTAGFDKVVYLDKNKNPMDWQPTTVKK